MNDVRVAIKRSILLWEKKRKKNTSRNERKERKNPVKIVSHFVKRQNKYINRETKETFNLMTQRSSLCAVVQSRIAHYAELNSSSLLFPVNWKF